jgi:hypothetical protein
MRTLGTILLSAALAFSGLGLNVAWAADGDAGQAGAFLTYGAGARAIGMGRAFTGIADDATALYWNPGGLTGMRQNQALFQFATLIDGSTYQYLGYGHLLPYIGTLGFGLLMLNQGEAEGRNELNEVTSSFSNRQLGVLLGFGADLTPQLAAGGTLKMINQTFNNLSGTGFGLDLGLMYRVLPMLNLGLSFQNLLAPSITLKSAAETYPMNMTFGVGALFFEDRLKVDLDLSKNTEQDSLKPRFGFEMAPVPDLRDLFVRAGIDDTEIAVGAGYGYQGFQLDYALGFQTVEMMHKVTLSYGFGGFVLEVVPEPASFSPVGINKVSVLKINSQTKFQIRVWTLEISNDAGGLVRKYTGEGSPPNHIVWDGLQDNLTPMADGRYLVVLTVEDASGATRKSSEAWVAIQSVLPLGVSPVEVFE